MSNGWSVLTKLGGETTRINGPRVGGLRPNSPIAEFIKLESGMNIFKKGDRVKLTKATFRRIKSPDLLGIV